jgi:glycosyltransferase involved in cell wall biosynthesis
MRKIIIFYPNNTGGVAEVCASIKKGLEEHGYSVICVVNIWQAIKISIKSIFGFTTYGAITNLKFGFFGLFFKHSTFIIHGFPQRSHSSYLKYFIVVMGHRFFAKFNTYTVAVSYLTKFAVENFYNINVHEVIPNILPSTFVDSVSHIGTEKQPNSLIFVGRVIKEKGIEQILKAVAALRKKQILVYLHIVGDGYLLPYLKQQFQHTNTYFHGFVSAQRKYELLNQCVSFISLHPAEPFGITALEASVLGLNCCLSSIGGHFEFANGNQLHVINNVNDIQNIAQVIEHSLVNYTSQVPINIDSNTYYYNYGKSYLKTLAI